MNARNPLVDPQSGDVVKHETENSLAVWEVTWRTPRKVGFKVTQHSIFGSADPLVRWAYLGEWRNEMKRKTWRVV